MATKALSENQCLQLHRFYPPPNCCICNGQSRIEELEAENAKLREENAKLKEAILSHLQSNEIWDTDCGESNGYGCPDGTGFILKDALREALKEKP